MLAGQGTALSWVSSLCIVDGSTIEGREALMLDCMSQLLAERLLRYRGLGASELLDLNQREDYGLRRLTDFAILEISISRSESMTHL